MSSCRKKNKYISRVIYFKNLKHLATIFVSDFIKKIFSRHVKKKVNFKKSFMKKKFGPFLSNFYFTFVVFKKKIFSIFSNIHDMYIKLSQILSLNY